MSFEHKKLVNLLFCPLVFSNYTNFSIKSLLKIILLSVKIFPIFNVVSTTINISCRQIISKLNWMMSSRNCVQVSLKRRRKNCLHQRLVHSISHLKNSVENREDLYAVQSFFIIAGTVTPTWSFVGIIASFHHRLFVCWGQREIYFLNYLRVYCQLWHAMNLSSLLSEFLWWILELFLTRS